MSRIVVEYQPNISKKTKDLIRTNVTPSMISYDESSSQYEISMILIEIEKFGVENYKQDVELIEGLIEEGVHYIEF